MGKSDNSMHISINRQLKKIAYPSKFPTSKGVHVTINSYKKRCGILKKIYIGYSPARRSVLGKTVTEVLALNTEGTVFPNTD